VREEIPSGIKTEFLTVASVRRKPAGSKATSAEVEALFRSMFSYGDTHTIDGNEITHHVSLPRPLRARH
jgi:hypothetical protein